MKESRVFIVISGYKTQIGQYSVFYTRLFHIAERERETILLKGIVLYIIDAVIIHEMFKDIC